MAYSIFKRRKTNTYKVYEISDGVTGQRVATFNSYIEAEEYLKSARFRGNTNLRLNEKTITETL